MVQIEYDNVKLDVPENWDDITLGRYEAFRMDGHKTARERVALVAKVCNTDAELLLGWPAEVFNRIVEYLTFLFEDANVPPCSFVEVDGVKYVVPIEDELSLGAYVDADEAQKHGDAVLSNILAIVCRPAGEVYDYKNNDTRREMFATLPVGRVLGVLAFFLHCKTVLDKRIAVYSNLAQTCDLLPRNIRLSLNHGGGIKLLRIWPAVKYYVLMRLLHFRLRKYLRSFNTVKTKTRPKRRSAN